MKKSIILLFIITIFNSCTDSLDLHLLNGYWEIDEVILNNGTSKEYKINTTIDFFELKPDSSGIRTKLYPMADGTYRTNTDVERFKIIYTSQETIIEYDTEMDRWTELIEELDENRLVLKNDSAIRYIYKRFEKYNFNDYREKQ